MCRRIPIKLLWKGGRKDKEKKNPGIYRSGNNAYDTTLLKNIKQEIYLGYPQKRKIWRYVWTRTARWHVQIKSWFNFGMGPWLIFWSILKYLFRMYILSRKGLIIHWALAIRKDAELDLLILIPKLFSPPPPPPTNPLRRGCPQGLTFLRHSDFWFLRDISSVLLAKRISASFSSGALLCAQN